LSLALSLCFCFSPCKWYPYLSRRTFLFIFALES